MFGEIICRIVSSTKPVDDKLTLCNAIFDSVKLYVNCFGAALFDAAIIGDAGVTCIISFDWGCRLWMTHIFKRGLEHGSIFPIVEKCTQFGVNCWRQEGLRDGAVDMADTVFCWRCGIRIGCNIGVCYFFAEKEDNTGMWAGFEFGKVRGIVWLLGPWFRFLLLVLKIGYRGQYSTASTWVDHNHQEDLPSSPACAVELRKKRQNIWYGSILFHKQETAGSVLVGVTRTMSGGVLLDLLEEDDSTMSTILLPSSAFIQLRMIFQATWSARSIIQRNLLQQPSAINHSQKACTEESNVSSAQKHLQMIGNTKMKNLKILAVSKCDNNGTLAAYQK
jgi:hypothetical protein